jgi:hypothetical protein
MPLLTLNRFGSLDPEQSMNNQFERLVVDRFPTSLMNRMKDMVNLACLSIFKPLFEWGKWRSHTERKQHCRLSLKKNSKNNRTSPTIYSEIFWIIPIYT